MKSSPWTPAPAPQAHAPPPAIDERAKALTLAAALLGLFLSALDQTIVATALPQLAVDLRGLDLYAWVTTAYLLASTAMVPVYGKLSDIHGRRPILVTGIVLFVSASALCGLAPTMPLLVAARALQGLGAAALTSTAFAVVADLYEPARRARIQGFFGAVFGLSSIVGPVLGGVLTEYLSWRAVFYVNLPVGAVALAFALTKMPRLGGGLRQRIDWPGSALLVSGITAALLGLSLDQKLHPWNSTERILLVAGGAALLVAFVAWERRAQAPVLPLALFRNRTFAAVMAMSFVFGGGYFASLLFIPLFMERVVGVSPSESGATLMPLTLAVVASAVAAGQAASRVGRAKPFVVAGLALMVVAAALLARMGLDTDASDVRLRLVLLGLGVGPALPLLTLVAQNAVARADLGVATSSRQFFQQLGSVFGAAALGVVLNASLAKELPARLDAPLAALPAAARDGFEPTRVAVSAHARSALPPGLDAHARGRADARRREVERALGGGDPASRARLLTDPATPPEVLAALQTREPTPEARAVALGALGREEAASRANLLGAWRALIAGVREAFSVALGRVFTLAFSLAAVALVLAFALRDVPFGGRPAPPIE